MGHAIPKIHYAVVTTTGDTHTSTTIDNISDTSSIAAGMYVSGSGVPTGATVISVASTSVVISAPTTTTLAGTAVEFYKKIEFDYPPIETTGEKLLPQERRSVALSGVTQISIDYIEGVRDLNFRFLSNTLYTSLKSFYDNYAAYGDSFRYFDDKTLTLYNTYELKTFDWLPQKITARGTTYVWGLPLTFRRVVA